MTDQPASFWAIATSASVVRRSAKIAMVVGTILALINHGDLMMTGAASATTFFKIGLTYLVPFSVSTYASVQAVRDRLQRVDAEP